MEQLLQLQSLLKKSTLNGISYWRGTQIIQTIEDSHMKESLGTYLKTEFEFSKTNQGFTLSTSDIIESLFGKYKYIAKPNAFSEINRMILILPILCEDITPDLIQNAFQETTNKQTQEWIKQEVGTTLLAKRRKAFEKNQQK